MLRIGQYVFFLLMPVDGLMDPLQLSTGPSTASRKATGAMEAALEPGDPGLTQGIPAPADDAGAEAGEADATADATADADAVRAAAEQWNALPPRMRCWEVRAGSGATNERGRRGGASASAFEEVLLAPAEHSTPTRAPMMQC